MERITIEDVVRNMERTKIEIERSNCLPKTLKAYGSLSLIVVSLAMGCSTLDTSPPCFDGWTTDESGSSVVWEPPSSTIRKIGSLLPEGANVTCIHKLPSGKLHILYGRDPIEYKVLMPKGDGFDIVDSGIIPSR